MRSRREGSDVQPTCAIGHSVLVVARRPMLRRRATPVAPDPDQARGVSPMMAATYMRRGMAAEKQARYRLPAWRSVIDFAVL